MKEIKKWQKTNCDNCIRSGTGGMKGVVAGTECMLKVWLEGVKRKEELEQPQYKRVGAEDGNLPELCHEFTHLTMPVPNKIVASIMLMDSFIDGKEAELIKTRKWVQTQDPGEKKDKFNVRIERRSEEISVFRNFVNELKQGGLIIYPTFYYHLKSEKVEWLDEFQAQAINYSNECRLALQEDRGNTPMQKGGGIPEDVKRKAKPKKKKDGKRNSNKKNKSVEQSNEAVKDKTSSGDEA